MVVADMKTLNVLVTPAIAASPEAAEYDPGTGLAFSSNGEGTMTIVKNVGGKWSTVYTVQTERSARTMTLDPKTHRIYLLAAEYGAPGAKSGEKQGRPTVLPAFTSWWSVNSAKPLIRRAPGRLVRPLLERFGGPLGVLLRVAQIARIWHFQALGFHRRDEPEGVAPDIHVRDRLFDSRHVAVDALASGGARLVMCVLFNCEAPRSIRRRRAVTLQAHGTGRLQ